MPQPPSALYFHSEYDAYECLGCGEPLEVPYRAILSAGRGPVPVKNDPENRLLWLELQELDHAACGQFKDAQMAEDARRFRKSVLPGGRNVSRSSRGPAPLAP